VDYNKLETLRKVKKYSQEELAKKITMTKNGYQQAIKNDTLKVKDLENIASVLGVHVSAFFSENSLINSNNSTCHNCEQLQKLVDSQAKHIDRLELELQECRKIEKKKAS
jgi:transcriptional regulator with XRE-family HTH domain